MKKLRLLLKAPVLTQSGYGVHSRQIFRALASEPAFDIFIESIRWGDCAYLVHDTEEKRKIKECTDKYMMHKVQNKLPEFDIFVHVTIPTEFERRAKFNVGVTAGIETDRVSANWIAKCNEMDMIIVPSEHSKKTLAGVQYQVRASNDPNAPVHDLRLVKPIVVCPEGVDTNVFKKMTVEEVSNVPVVASLKFETDFNYLHVGQWGPGGYGEDRKNIANLVKYFIETFRGEKDVGLVLKVNMARNSVADYENIVRRLTSIKSNYPANEVPPIYLVHASLTDQEMAALYNHPQIKALVSLTHGEGFGLPLLEAAACSLPIIATNWSGHLDFLKKGLFSAVSYEMKQIPKVAEWADIMIPGSNWAEVSQEDAKHRLKKMTESYSKPKEWAAELAKEVALKYNLDSVCQKFLDSVKRTLLHDVVEKLNPIEHLQSLVDTPDDYNVLFTMPRSTGDVYIATAVISGLVRQLPDNHKIYFATQPEYASILDENPNIYKVIPWGEYMLNPEIGEQVFDLVLTPDSATQYNFSNFVRKGQGRLLAEEYAAHCNCELGDYFIKKDYRVPELAQFEEDYITFHPGSGKDQWAGRRYDDWQEVLNNLRAMYPDLKIVQVGSANEPTFEGIDLDLRGKTDVHQLAAVLAESKMHLSIDTFTMHLAASEYVPVVAIFGCSHAQATGPWVADKKKAKFFLIESQRETGCKNRACYKANCIANPDTPPINEIDAATITEASVKLLDQTEAFSRNKEVKYQRMYGKISGYTTTYNIEGYPFVESIKSMLGFCDEVVVVDGYSTDGTYETLQKLQTEYPEKLKLHQNEWNFEEPGMDGLQKALARSLCENEFLWQQDCDEVVHEDDYEKIRLLTKRFPKNVDILHLPVIELWGNESTVTGRRHAWKWRLSRNKLEITHGINKHARLLDEATGKTYAKEGMSDGCEYIETMTGEPLKHVGFWSNNFELARIHMPEQYAEGMNNVFNKFPSVFHYSWCSLENKVNNFKNKWDKQWNCLYKTQNKARFPEVQTDEQVKEVAQKMFEQGGEDSDQLKYKFELKRTNPAVMKDWLAKVPLNR